MSKRPGRPPLDAHDRSVTFTVTLPSKGYDALYRTATADRQTVPQFVRSTLARAIKTLNSQTRHPSR
jgi:hypothetical protein